MKILHCHQRELPAFEKRWVFFLKLQTTCPSSLIPTGLQLESIEPADVSCWPAERRRPCMQHMLQVLHLHAVHKRLHLSKWPNGSVSLWCHCATTKARNLPQKTSVCVCTCACSFIGPGWLPGPKSKTRRVICSSVSLSELKSLSVSLSFNSEYLGVPRPCKQSVLTQCQQIDFSIECFKTLLNQTSVQCQACTSGPL